MGATPDLTFMFWIIANDCARRRSMYPRMHHKLIELWGIISTSGNFRPYQIQTAFIHCNAIDHLEKSRIAGMAWCVHIKNIGGFGGSASSSL